MTLTRDIYSTAELAQELRVSERVIRNAFNSGELKGAKPGGKIRVWREDALTWLAEHCGAQSKRRPKGREFAGAKGRW